MGKWLAMLNPEPALLPVSVKVHGLTPAEREAADDWQEIQHAPVQQEAFAKSLSQRREMEQGKVPTHYTERATCKHCGPVWLWFASEVDGCPWCFIRAAGHPIPRLEIISQDPLQRR